MKFYLVDDVAKEACLTKMAIRKAANDGKLRSYRTVGNVRIFLESDVMEWINSPRRRKNRVGNAA